MSACRQRPSFLCWRGVNVEGQTEDYMWFHIWDPFSRQRTRRMTIQKVSTFQVFKSFLGISYILVLRFSSTATMCTVRFSQKRFTRNPKSPPELCLLTPNTHRETLSFQRGQMFSFVKFLRHWFLHNSITNNVMFLAREKLLIELSLVFHQWTASLSNKESWCVLNLYTSR